jgi:hypothetical protein
MIVAAMAQAINVDPDASFAASCAPGDNQLAEFTMINVDDGATGDESGNFEVWAGGAPGSLLLAGSAAIVAGVITSPDLGDEGDNVYVQLRKGGLPRSGIHLITLQADAANEYIVTGSLSPDQTGTYVESGTYNGKPAYTAGPTKWLFWLGSGFNTWNLAMEKETPPIAYNWYDETFASGDTPTLGTYQPENGASGVATISQ